MRGRTHTAIIPAAMNPPDLPGSNKNLTVENSRNALGQASVSFPRSWFLALPLHGRFAVAGGLVMIIGMLVAGSWVASQIEEATTHNSAISAALYMETWIAPLTDGLSETGDLSDEMIARLDNLFDDPHFTSRIAAVKIWRDGNRIAYASDHSLIGREFEPSNSLNAAWSGKLSAEFDKLGEGEDRGEATRGLPLLEVYNPIHSRIDGRIIGVAEFYQIATEFQQDLVQARLMSWVVIGSICLSMFGLLFGIVLRGARTIEQQRLELENRLYDVARVSEVNATLRRRIQAAARRGAEGDEKRMRRISADLHDGPAQTLAHASLRLDSLFRNIAKGGGEQEMAEIKTDLSDAMREMREICKGLSLPQLEQKDIETVLKLAVDAHQRRTGSHVEFSAPRMAADIDHPVAICLYRFVQEALTNGYRHGEGRNQRVLASMDDDTLRVAVHDDGPGFDTEAARGNGMGLDGLRDRVESVGGTFEVHSAPGQGTCVAMNLPRGSLYDRE